MARLQKGEREEHERALLHLLRRFTLRQRMLKEMIARKG
jgi:hypothetical protein